MEIAFFDRGPIDAKNLMLGGYWSAYWYNGNIYGSEIARGIDIFSLTPSEHLTQNELDAAMMIRTEELNTQEQQKIVWPAAMPVARAYLDQLTRSKGIQPERARAVKAAIDRADSIRTGKERGAAAVLDQLDAVAVSASKGDAIWGVGPRRDAVQGARRHDRAMTAKLRWEVTIRKPPISRFFPMLDGRPKGLHYENVAAFNAKVAASSGFLSWPTTRLAT